MYKKVAAVRFLTAFIVAVVLSPVQAADDGTATSSEKRPSLDFQMPDLSRPHPFSVYDMVSVERLGDVRPSPDGNWVVFSRRNWDADANKSTTNLWLVAIDGHSMRPLTTAKHIADSSPSWSPDGRTIGFVSNRSGSTQIWIISPDGGEARQLSHFPVDVANLQWSPTGTHLAFTTEVYSDADMRETAKRDSQKADSPVKAMKFDRLFIRRWDTWNEGKRNHVFVLPVAYDGSPDGRRDWKLSGEPIDAMKGVDGDCPSKPFGGAEEFAWSPDGKEIAYTAQIGSDEAWSTNLDIFVASISGGQTKCITSENRATDTQPTYSPKGDLIAYLAMVRPGYESDRRRIRVFDRTAGTSRTLTESWDRSPDSLRFTLDGKALIVSAEESARQKIFTIDSTTGESRVIVGDHYSSEISIVKTGSAARVTSGEQACRLVFLNDSLSSPAEIWVADGDEKSSRPLTRVNETRLKPARTSAPEEFCFDGAGNEKVQAWVLKPVGFDAQRAASAANPSGTMYPVAFIIHGGPQGAITDHFHYRWNLQAFAGAGYAVVAVNFHGSTGFGQKFTDSITGDWGGKPYEDLMKGLDYAIAQYPWLDGRRVAALGASYGGWMINWINGKTDRFRCLVNHDGGFDEFANYFTTEELWFPEWEYGGPPWEKPQLYEKFSPNRYVGRWKTPTLVIHGAKDYRVVDVEGIATFTALQRRGIPSQLLYFPDENHWVLKPCNSIVWHETILAWLDRWLN